MSLAASSRSACSCVHGACTLAQVPLAWSCVFVAVNAANASAIAADRWPGTLTPEEVELHQRHFNKLEKTMVPWADLGGPLARTGGEKAFRRSQAGY